MSESLYKTSEVSVKHTSSSVCVRARACILTQLVKTFSAPTMEYKCVLDSFSDELRIPELTVDQCVTRISPVLLVTHWWIFLHFCSTLI